MDKVKRYTMSDAGSYEILFEDGRTVSVPSLTSKGRLRPENEGGNYEHLIRYSDGKEERVILSVETATLPDHSRLS